MATLVVFIHQFDAFFVKGPSGSRGSPYLLFGVLQHLQKLGHKVLIRRGPKAIGGDVALLHVDSTVVEQEYLDLRHHYGRALNFRTGDISKRRISALLLEKGDKWAGPVMVKSNLNNNGLMEDLHNKSAARLGLPLPHPGVAQGEPYRVLDSLAEVAEEIWSDASLVVERFMPEPDPDGGFVIRTWVFIGSQERCTRFVTPDRISKAAGVTRHEPMEVPPALRAERERLGFDLGKFDFVVHDGQPILLDANRTPGVARAIGALMREGAPRLAQGLHELLSCPS